MQLKNNHILDCHKNGQFDGSNLTNLAHPQLLYITKILTRSDSNDQCICPKIVQLYVSYTEYNIYAFERWSVKKIIFICSLKNQ